MFTFIKEVFTSEMTPVGCGASKYVSISAQECKIRLVVMNVNSNESLIYPYIVFVNKWSGSCSDINNPYAKLFVPGAVKDMNIKVFNLISKTNEMLLILWHKTFACKYRLDTSVCNDKQRRNNDKCRCECKEVNDKGRFNIGFI